MNTMTKTRVEVVRCFGGGFELSVDGKFFGIFPTARAAREFAKGMV